MNHTEAFEILEIDLNVTSLSEINSDYLKKQYRRLALKNHPDKNHNSIESNDRFKLINEAYEFLKRETGVEEDVDSDADVSVDSSLYFNILKDFMKTVFEGNYTDLLTKIVNDIMTTGKKFSSRIFDGMSREASFEIYTFLSINRSILHLSQEVIDLVREIVVKKYGNDVEVYRLNPSIYDLINNNIYKLYVNSELFLVPLWHNECYFDGSGCEIIVICEPELPEGISIDDDNNIFIENITIKSNELTKLILEDGNIEVCIGDIIHTIPVNKLYMKKSQCYRIKNTGLSKFKKDIYDISEKTDIIVKIYII